jgi:hypothetical protein
MVAHGTGRLWPHSDEKKGVELCPRHGTVKTRSDGGLSGTRSPRERLGQSLPVDLRRGRDCRVKRLKGPDVKSGTPVADEEFEPALRVTPDV